MQNEVTPIENITVALGDQQHTLYRDEIMRDEDMSKIFVMYEALQQDIVDINATIAESIRMQVTYSHAARSMEQTLQVAANKYILDLKGAPSTISDIHDGGSA